MSCSPELTPGAYMWRREIMLVLREELEAKIKRRGRETESEM